MSLVPEQQQSERSVRDRVARLRVRLARVYSNPMDLVPIMKGILDLLDDELGEVQDRG